MTVRGPEGEVADFADEVRRHRATLPDGGTVVDLRKWGWPVPDGPTASYGTEAEDYGRVAGTTEWAPPLGFLTELTRRRPLLVECDSTTENEEHEKWVAWRGECRHLLTVVDSVKDGVVTQVRVAGQTVDDRPPDMSGR